MIHCTIQIAVLESNLRPKYDRNLVQNDRYDPERPRYLSRHHASVSLHTIQGSDRTDEIRQLRQNRARLERLVVERKLVLSLLDFVLAGQCCAQSVRSL